MPKYSKTAFQLRSVDGNLRALRGRIDDFIFRTRNGKIFAFYKPIRNRLNPDAISVHLREIATLYNLEIVATKRQNRALAAKKSLNAQKRKELYDHTRNSRPTQPSSPTNHPHQAPATPHGALPRNQPPTRFRHQY